MHKIFLAVASMIVTHFLQKAYRKITEKPTIDKDEIYRQMKKAEYDARRAAARPVIAKLDSISTSEAARLHARLMHETRNICRMTALSPKEKREAYNLLTEQ